jgi:hypothetical protein
MHRDRSTDALGIRSSTSKTIPYSSIDPRSASLLASSVKAHWIVSEWMELSSHPLCDDLLLARYDSLSMIFPSAE